MRAKVDPLYAVAMVVVVCAFSATAPLTAVATAPALALAFWRTGLGAVVNGAIVAGLRHGELRRMFRGERPMVRGEQSRCIGLGVLASFCLALHFATFMSAAKLTSVAMATALVSTQPIWQALISVATGRRLPGRVWTGLAMAVLGVVVASGIDVQSGGNALLGDALAIVGAISLAGYTAISEQARTGLSAPVYSALSSLLCAAGLLVTCLVLGTPLLRFDQSTLLALLGLILLPQLLGLGSLNFALGRGPATTTSVLLLLEGPVAATVAWMWMSQAPALWSLPGLLLIIVGAGVVLSSGTARDESSPATAWNPVVLDAGLDVGRMVARMPTMEFKLPTPPPGRDKAAASGPRRAGAASPKPAPRGWARRGGLVAVLTVPVLVAAVLTGQAFRPMPKPTVRLTLPAQHTFQGSVPVMPWPAQGQAAMSVDGLGPMGSSGGAAPVPIAGLAKLMTAYVVLRDHPLKPGTHGPVLSLSPRAADLPQGRHGASSVEVIVERAFTLRRVLEAVLLVSADDVAGGLARWDAGGTPEFVRKMNAAARALGMTSTTYTDPTGHDVRTVSTAADQVTLLRAAMRVPAFAEIIGTRRPGRTLSSAAYTLVGRYGIVAGKSGYSGAAGGTHVFAARKRTGNATTLIVGAVLGQRPGALAALAAARGLVLTAQNALTAATLAPAGSPVAELDDGLGGRTQLRAAAPVTMVGWPGLTVPVRAAGDPPRHAESGTCIGSVVAGAAQTPLVLAGPLREPSIVKRLLRLN